MNKSGLLLRLAISIGFAAVFVGFISSQVFYKLTYQSNLDKTQTSIEQLYEVVSPTSKIAAYLSDEELAKEVVNGLSASHVIYAAAFQTPDFTVYSERYNERGENQSQFIVTSPFVEGEVLGSVLVQQNLEFIKTDSEEAASFVSNSLLMQALVVTLIAIFISFYFITRPMLVIAKTLHLLNPGTARRLKKPMFHNQSELGDLVSDINLLLEKAEDQITKERELRNEIEVLEKRFRLLFENSVAPIILMEPRGNILLTNNAFKTLLEQIDLPFKKNFGPMLSEIFESSDTLQKSVNNAFLNDEIAIGEYKLNAQSNNQSVWLQVVVSNIVTDDLKSYYQITLNDVSKKRAELEQLSRRADFDSLTKLLNRGAAEKQIEQLQRNETPFMFALMDLNGFKQINDIYGHDAGDEVLIYVAKQLKQIVVNHGIACRWGGDEFVLVIPNISQTEMTALANRLIHRVTKPYLLMSHNTNVSVGLCMGISNSPADSPDMSELIHMADQAMYSIKLSSKQENGQLIAFAQEAERNHE